MLRRFWRGNADLVILFILQAILGLSIVLQAPAMIRVVLSVVCIFFSPGYTLLSALYPQKAELNPGQRLFGGIVLSVVVYGMIMYITAATIGMTLTSSYYILTIIVVLFSAITLMRRIRITEDQRFITDLSAWGAKARSLVSNRNYGVWLGIVGLLIVGVVVSFVLWNSLRARPQYAQFYILNKDGIVSNFPNQIVPGGEMDILVGVVNRQGRPMKYRVEYGIEGEPMNYFNLSLPLGFIWEQPVIIKLPVSPGVSRVNFDLIDVETGSVLHQLHLWVDTSGSG